MKKRITVMSGLGVLILLGSIWLIRMYLTDSEISIHGENLNQLDSPMGAATDDQNVYIANSNKHQISVFNVKGEFQFPIGSKGKAEGELNFPVDVDLYKEQLYVADLENFRVCIFNKNGQFLDYFPRERNIKPAALTIWGEYVYVSDIYSHTIKKFSLTGELLESFSELGSNEGQLQYANGVAVSSDGKIFVSDSLNQRIQQFSKHGKFIKTLNQDERLGMPRGMFIMENNIYVADAQSHEILVMDFEGKKRKALKTKEALEFPTDIFLTKKYIVVTDNAKNEVRLIKRGSLNEE